MMSSGLAEYLSPHVLYEKNYYLLVKQRRSQYVPLKTADKSESDKYIMETKQNPNPAEQTKPFLAVGRYQSYKTLFTANRRFRRFWLAGVISHLGNSVW